MDKRSKYLFLLIGIVIITAIVIIRLNNKDDILLYELEEQVHYKNEKLGFTLSMDQSDFDSLIIRREGYFIYFISKDINENYPEYHMGTVLRVEAYNKKFYDKSHLDEKAYVYNYKYLGENDKYYIGYAFPTDVQYPMDNLELKDIYQKLSKNAEEIVKTIEIIEPEGERFINNLKLAYEGRMDYTHEIIGQGAEQYINKEPAIISYLLGGLVISYDDNDPILFTNGYFETDDKVVAGDIVMISKAEAYGIKSGMSMDEVENILREPDYIIDYSLEPGSELFGMSTCSYYEVGDYEVTIEFDRWGKTVKRIYLRGNRHNPVGAPNTNFAPVDFINLTDEELQVYNKFKEKYNEEVLRELGPISIMRLYIHALKEKEYEAEWELYTKEEDQLGWDKEYHMNIPDGHRVSNFGHYENPVNIIVQDGTDYAVVTWEDKYLEEYDTYGYPFRFGFSLVKSKDGIWKVAFLPMQ